MNHVQGRCFVVSTHFSNMRYDALLQYAKISGANIAPNSDILRPLCISGCNYVRAGPIGRAV